MLHAAPQCEGHWRMWQANRSHNTYHQATLGGSRGTTASVAQLHLLHSSACSPRRISVLHPHPEISKRHSSHVALPSAMRFCPPLCLCNTFEGSMAIAQVLGSNVQRPDRGPEPRPTSRILQGLRLRGHRLPSGSQGRTAHRQGTRGGPAAQSGAGADSLQRTDEVLRVCSMATLAS